MVLGARIHLAGTIKSVKEGVVTAKVVVTVTSAHICNSRPECS